MELRRPSRVNDTSPRQSRSLALIRAVVFWLSYGGLPHGRAWHAFLHVLWRCILSIYSGHFLWGCCGWYASANQFEPASDAGFNS